MAFLSLLQITPLCIPITLLAKELNIGEPDEPISVLHLCFISYSFIFSIPHPYDTLASPAFGKCKIYICSSI